MGKTKRTASRWMESRFKLGDPMYPNETHFFDGRYQNKIRNGHKTYMHEEIDPRSMKTLHWAEYSKGFKASAKRAARHKAKIMVIIECHQIMQEEFQMEQELWDDEDWYDEDMMGFDFSYSDEARDYAEQRRREEELLDEYEYQSRMYQIDWYYDGYY